MSSNSEVGLPEDEPSGVADVIGQMFPYDPASAADDWDARQDWQDLWRVSYVK